MDHNRATYYHVFDFVISPLIFYSLPKLPPSKCVPSNGIANTLHKPARINGAHGPCLTLGVVYSCSIPVRKGTERVDEREKC